MTYDLINYMMLFVFDVVVILISFFILFWMAIFLLGKITETARDVVWEVIDRFKKKD